MPANQDKSTKFRLSEPNTEGMVKGGGQRRAPVKPKPKVSPSGQKKPPKK